MSRSLKIRSAAAMAAVAGCLEIELAEVLEWDERTAAVGYWMKAIRMPKVIGAEEAGVRSALLP